jgi:hypothetical protein
VIVVFCSDPLAPRAVDSAYAEEAAAADAAGFEPLLIDYEALVDGGEVVRAVRRVPIQSPARLAAYRGWMLRPGDYATLYEALLDRGVRLLNDPAAYRHCHHLPEWYSLLQHETPRSVWTDSGGEVSSDRLAVELTRQALAGASSCGTARKGTHTLPPSLRGRHWWC